MASTRADDPDPADIPPPSQARADAIKERSAGTAPTEPPAVVDTPVVLVAGAIAATANAGDTLTCTMGNWIGEPDFYAFQWKSDGTTDLGTGQTYVVGGNDAGHGISCVVTARNAAGLTTAPPSNAVTVAAAQRS